MGNGFWWSRSNFWDLTSNPPLFEAKFPLKAVPHLVPLPHLTPSSSIHRPDNLGSKKTGEILTARTSPLFFVQARYPPWAILSESKVVSRMWHIRPPFNCNYTRPILFTSARISFSINIHWRESACCIPTTTTPSFKPHIILGLSASFLVIKKRVLIMNQ